MKNILYFILLFLTISCKKEYKTEKKLILPNGYYELCYTLPISGGWNYYTFFYINDNKFYCSNRDSVVCNNIAGEFSYDKNNKPEVPVLAYLRNTKSDPCSYDPPEIDCLYLSDITDYLSEDKTYWGLKGNYERKEIGFKERGSFKLYSIRK